MNCKIYFVGLASAFADVATTWLGLQYSEIAERNPLANPFVEAAAVLGAQGVILHFGKKLQTNPKLTVALALVPAMVPFGAAANNIVHIAVVHAKYYPWKECPLLYSEGEKK